ncbi:hypothetical protein [Sphingosinicella sp. BN140058]|nr:hypothetical protein [Sphingosinicella sp. BN140058]
MLRIQISPSMVMAILLAVSLGTTGLAIEVADRNGAIAALAGI